MKRFLPLLMLTGLLFGQDVLTLENGEQFKGKYLGNDAKQVAFKTRTKLMRFNMEEVKEIVSSDGEVVFSVEMLEQKKAKALAKRQNEIAELLKKCEEQRASKVLIIPIKNDYYGITEIIEQQHDSLCYTIIDNNVALKYLHEENVSSDDINDFHLKEAGKFVGANIVIYGYAYTFDVPFKYSPTTSDALSIGELWENEYSDAWTDLFFALGKSLVVGGQLSNRQKAITDAGTYVKLTYYAINIDTGKKVFITKNMTVLKIG